jgi:hypothetical protein
VRVHRPCCRYLSLHFGPLEIAFADFLAEIGILADGLDFPKKCGDLVMSWAQKQGAATGRALDLGCAVGRWVGRGGVALTTVTHGSLDT